MRLAACIAMLLTATAFAVDCPLWVETGDSLRVVVWYPHESSPGVQYSYTVNDIADETGRANVAAQGHPIGCRWDLNGKRVLFYDDFESNGDSGRWSSTVQ